MRLNNKDIFYANEYGGFHSQYFDLFDSFWTIWCFSRANHLIFIAPFLDAIYLSFLNMALRIAAKAAL